MNTSTRRRRTSLLTALAASSLLALTACGGSGGTSSGDAALAPAADAPRELADKSLDSASMSLTDSGVDFQAENAAPVATDGLHVEQANTKQSPISQAVISNGSVSLESDDVSKAQFDVQAVIDDHNGTTAQEKTETGDDGTIARARMVFRVPAAEFQDTIAALKKIGVNTGSATDSEDVTTQVIDTDVRVRAQEKSIERIEVLYSRAQSIRDIMAIEAQLQRRQAELDSLKQQQAWLADQTSLSTITVHVQLPPEKKKHAAGHDDSGFTAGLAAGWTALKKGFVHASTAIGALLPFAILALIVGLPLWLVWRSRRRSEDGADTTGIEPEPAT